MQHLHSQNDEKIKNLHETFREKKYSAIWFG